MLTFQLTLETWARVQMSIVLGWEAKVFSRSVLSGGVYVEGGISSGDFHVV